LKRGVRFLREPFSKREDGKNCSGWGELQVFIVFRREQMKRNTCAMNMISAALIWIGAALAAGCGPEGTDSAPATPTGVSASAQSSSGIRVSWNAVEGANNYIVYRAASASGAYSEVGWTFNTYYTDTGLSSNATYYYKVAAQNGIGTSSQSSSVSAKTTTTSSTSETGTIKLTNYTKAAISVSVSGGSYSRTHNVGANSSVSISGVPVGTYTVASSGGGGRSITVSKGSATIVTFY
jgi:hypothetical protein